MVWLDLDVEPALDTGTPSVEAHSSTVSHLFAKILTSLDKFEYVWTSLALGLLYSRTTPNQKGRTESH